MSDKGCCKDKSACGSIMGCGGDVVTKGLCKVGISTSMLVTLALLPFAWDGINWIAIAVRELWSLVSSV